MEYGNESLAISDLNEDLHEVLHITQNLSGVPPYKLKIFKEVFLEKFRSKKALYFDGSKEERVIGLTSKEVCDYYKEKTGKTITTNNMKQNYLDEFINNGIVDTPDAENFDNSHSKESTVRINKLSISDRMYNILQHPKLLKGI